MKAGKEVRVEDSPNPNFHNDWHGERMQIGSASPSAEMISMWSADNLLSNLEGKDFSSQGSS